MNASSYGSVPTELNLHDFASAPGIGHTTRRTAKPPKSLGMKSYALLLSPFIVAVAAAMGQHVYYGYHNGKVVT
jgi:hypothetical protein